MTTKKTPKPTPKTRFVRHFGTTLSFVAEKPGIWTATHGKETLTLEYHGSRSGCPPGWYYTGPGARNGTLCGPQIADAAKRAGEAVAEPATP